MVFRKDINGLRALAVVAVVVFHFNASFLPGGFAGVDVFFVISGYLMTGIILKGIERKNFSLLGFYASRASRIVPPLAFLCVTLLVLGWLYLSPLDYALLGKHVFGSIFFISNFIFMKESGYFDIESHDTWLLHTWSLSVEWQFYLLFPIALWIISKSVRFDRIKGGILVIGLAGFMYSLFLTYSAPNDAFYLFSSRAWEMIFGGIVFLFPIKMTEVWKRLVEIVGLTLIALSYLLLSGDDIWPGYLAIAPVGGTMLVLWAHQTDSIFTNNILSQKIGSASYSIYLWHWPIAVTMNYLGGDELKFQIFGVILSFVLGGGAYLVIEKKFSLKHIKIKLFSVSLSPVVVLMTFVAMLGTGVYLDNGMAFRGQELAMQKITRSPLAYDCSRNINDPGCQYFSNNLEWAVLGNSHAVEISYALALKLKAYNIGLKQFTAAGCDVSYLREGEAECIHWNNRVVKEIINDERIKNVVISFRITSSLFGDNTASYPDLPDDTPVLADGLSKREGRENILLSMIALIQDISAVKESVFVILPIPELDVNINKIAFKSIVFGNDISSIKGPSRAYYEARNKAVLDAINTADLSGNVRLIDTAGIFCDKESCYSFLNGDPLYFDDDHPSVIGAKLIVNEISVEHE